MTTAFAETIFLLCLVNQLCWLERQAGRQAGKQATGRSRLDERLHYKSVCVCAHPATNASATTTAAFGLSIGAGAAVAAASVASAVGAAVVVALLLVDNYHYCYPRGLVANRNFPSCAGRYLNTAVRRIHQSCELACVKMLAPTPSQIAHSQCFLGMEGLHTRIVKVYALILRALLSIFDAHVELDGALMRRRSE